jgi:hypothetical protein
MHETPQQYTDRILSYQEGRDPLSVMAATPKKLVKLLKGMTRTALYKRPAADKWSIGEVLAHLADAEVSYSWRIRMMLAASGRVVQAYDQDAWARLFNYPKQNPRLSLDGYRIERERNVQLLRMIPKEIWENFGMHEERGKETITRLTEMMAGHDVNHLRQVEEMVKAMKKRRIGSKRKEARGKKRRERGRGTREWS